MTEPPTRLALDVVMNRRGPRAPALAGRCSFAPLALAGLLLPLACSSSRPTDEIARADVASDDFSAALPTEVLPVPPGCVWVGSSSEQLLATVTKLHPGVGRERQRASMLRKLLPELGRRRADVPGFHLSRAPVTNAQYQLFVRATGHRYPFSWWKEGSKAHHDDPATRHRYLEAFVGERNADLLYWEKHWRELPHRIPVGEEAMPVTFVSWPDAVEFASWAGMRLPEEAEWLRAAVGDQEREFVWGDTWNHDKLQKLALRNFPGRRLKAVGSLGAIVRGPFGHDDMAANVWEWTATVGFFPIAGRDAFDEEMRRLLDDSSGSRLIEVIKNGAGLPSWRSGHGVLKGGSYFSWQDPSEFRVQTRAHITQVQTLGGAGFRVAKSREAGRDFSRSRVEGLEIAGLLDHARQIGIERYDTSSGGHLIVRYHAISFVPVKQLAVGVTSTALGALVTTEPLADPKLPPGVYAVEYRNEGGARSTFVFRATRGGFAASSDKPLAWPLERARGTRRRLLETPDGKRSVLELRFSLPPSTDVDGILEFALPLELERREERAQWR